MPFSIRLLFGHSLGTLMALGLFLATFMAPAVPYAGYVDWPHILPAFRPFAIGLAVSIWLLALIPATLVNAILTRIGLIYRTDYMLIGFTIGLLIGVPVVNYMTTPQVVGLLPPSGGFTTSLLYFRTVAWLLAFSLSGAAFGLAYWLFISPSRR